MSEPLDCATELNVRGAKKGLLDHDDDMPMVFVLHACSSMINEQGRIGYWILLERLLAINLHDSRGRNQVTTPPLTLLQTGLLLRGMNEGVGGWLLIGWRNA